MKVGDVVGVLETGSWAILLTGRIVVPVAIVTRRGATLVVEPEAVGRAQSRLVVAKRSGTIRVVVLRAVDHIGFQFCARYAAVGRQLVSGRRVARWHAACVTGRRASSCSDSGCSCRSCDHVIRTDQSGVEVVIRRRRLAFAPGLQIISHRVLAGRPDTTSARRRLPVCTRRFRLDQCRRTVVGAS